MPEVVLGERLGVEDVVAVARGGAAVRVAPVVHERLRAARAVVERLAASEEPVYGLTTGLGAKSSLRLPTEEREAFQTRVLLGRAVAAGEPYPTDVVRAMLLARAAGLAQGGSGISPPVFEALLALLDRRVHPIVPSLGSVGTADLALCAALALPLIGLGEAELAGERLPGAEALRRAGLEPVALHVKDGLALASANAGSVGHGALVAHDARVFLDTALAAGALSLAGFQGSLTPFEAEVAAPAPARGQEDAARRLRALAEPGTPRLLQDPLSFRCLAAIQGAADDALARAREAVEVELNSAADNPLVLVERGAMVSNGNFHVAALALAFEGLGLAVAQLALAAAQRVLRLLEPRRSGLPLGLTRRDDRAGLVPARDHPEPDLGRAASARGARFCSTACRWRTASRITPRRRRRWSRRPTGCWRWPPGSRRSSCWWRRRRSTCAGAPSRPSRCERCTRPCARRARPSTTTARSAASSRS